MSLTRVAVSVAQKRIRELEDDIQKQGQGYRETIARLEGEALQDQREIATAKQQIRRAQEREEELQNQVRKPSGCCGPVPHGGCVCSRYPAGCDALARSL